ncbi:MAG: YkgJ family cysteine cluster protein [Candidatus Bathyarchaeota archaeon]|nr:YkgJ family cysteine cluster protein [Candidatus Bathyarchaeota archaeon]
MIADTFYLHLEFKGKTTCWSINLPFLCDICGVCCTLDDFLNAGEINANPTEYTEIHAKIRALFDKLGVMWEADQDKYENYITHTSCPFLVNNTCSIYEIRPEGCRLFPKTFFGMLTEDCEALNRFKRMRAALKKGRRCKETYCFTKGANGIGDEPIKPVNFTQKQYQNCIVQLQQVGITTDEMVLFNVFNEQKISSQVS